MRQEQCFFRWTAVLAGAALRQTPESLCDTLNMSRVAGDLQTACVHKVHGLLEAHQIELDCKIRKQFARQ